MLCSFPAMFDEMNADHVGIDRCGNDRFGDNFLERLEQMLARQHQEIPGCVDVEAFEG